MKKLAFNFVGFMVAWIAGCVLNDCWLEIDSRSYNMAYGCIVGLVSVVCGQWMESKAATGGEGTP